MGPTPESQVRFGRRGKPPRADAVRAADVRRAVAALHGLSRELRFDPRARIACLFHALRSHASALPTQILLRRVDDRIGAFEFMIANQPRALARGLATARLELAVYEAIATEPLITGAGRPRFDAASFIARVEFAATHQLVDGAAPQSERTRAKDAHAADAPRIEIIVSG